MSSSARGRRAAGTAPPVAHDRGAGSALLVGVVSVVALAGLTLVGASVGLARGQQLTAAADAAALAAGDVLLGWVAGEPCAAAARVAAAHSAWVLDCTSEGLTVTVRVGASILGLGVERTARAGAADLAE